MVSKTYEENQEDNICYSVKEKVVQRLKELNAESPDQLYEKCLLYLQKNSVITMIFNPNLLLEEGLKNFQISNTWAHEENKHLLYKEARDSLEKEIFEFLPNSVKEKFFVNKQARPRYGALLLLDKYAHIRPTAP